jgi:hypothetical protein
VAYNTKKIKRDVDGNPVPQMYNPATEEYEVLQGGSGASRHMLYSPDGTPVDTTGNKLGVRDDEVAQALAALLTQLDTTGVKKIIDALPAGNNKIGKVDVEASALPAGAATEAKQDSAISELQNLQGKDFATQATLAAILAKMPAAPATEAKQDSAISELQAIKGKDFATQTTLAAILSKIISAPATEAKQDTLNALIGEVQANPTANTILGRMKSLESKIDTLDVVIDSILAKIIAAPSTEAKQDTIIGYVDGVEAVLANILAKIIDSPATEAKQDTLISHVDGVEAALATLLTKAGFDAKADISLTALRDDLRGTGSKTLTDLANALVPLATAAKQDTLAGLVSTAANQTALQNLIGSLAAAAVTDPTASAALIQLLKGLLKQLQGGGTGAAPVQLTGSNVEIGGVSFAVSGGDTLRNTATNKPDAAAAHAVIPFCYYFSVDTGVVEVTDGTNWVVI